MNAKDVKARTKAMTNLDNLIVIDLVHKVEREIEHSSLLNKHSAIIEFPEIYKDFEKFELRLKQMLLEDKIEELP